MFRWSIRLLASAALVAVPLLWVYAQTPPMHPGMHPQADSPPQATSPAATVQQPTLPGQDAFGAIQEVVRILDADPNTDWRPGSLV